MTKSFLLSIMFLRLSLVCFKASKKRLIPEIEKVLGKEFSADLKKNFNLDSIMERIEELLAEKKEESSKKENEERIYH